MAASSVKKIERRTWNHGLWTRVSGFATGFAVAVTVGALTVDVTTCVRLLVAVFVIISVTRLTRTVVSVAVFVTVGPGTKAVTVAVRVLKISVVTVTLLKLMSCSVINIV